jgi:small subunit ribosomal protein S17e
VLRRKAEELYKMFPDKFSKDYESNKKILDSMKIFQNKIDRNIIAGYMVKLAQEKVL